MGVDYKDLQREYERACQEAGGPSLPSSGYDPFNEQAAPAGDLNGAWGNREVAADRNSVESRTVTNLPYRYVEGAGKAAEVPPDPKIRG